MELDVGKLMRLRGAMESAIEAGAAMHFGEGSLPLQQAYVKLRVEAANAIPDGVREEFERLFPERTPQVGAAIVALRGDAMMLLKTLAGWVGGIIEEAQFAARLHAEAEALAKERVKEERGVGFARPES
jgi:hypothetical protein